jgi:hypothetical protein
MCLVLGENTSLNIGREVGQLSKVVDLEEIKVVLEFIVT